MRVLVTGGNAGIGYFAAEQLHGKDAGARPAVRAVLRPDVEGGQLWGPRVFGLRGRPRLEPRWANLTDDAAAARLWTESVALTGLDPLG
ncbi:hypothetical protein [Amycolatopsis vancoresmycina]|uniref:Short-chain dehydrogenase n=1 Tax=Amycolatopsis vancoresmycina DSM 44592 TaxID=1292037 RepID=R1G539_9PSEU|nr:short-chain dehydrogenase [Amycolatopsis vancoresmycina DSM 44592]